MVEFYLIGNAGTAQQYLSVNSKRAKHVQCTSEFSALKMWKRSRVPGAGGTHSGRELYSWAKLVTHRPDCRANRGAETPPASYIVEENFKRNFVTVKIVMNYVLTRFKILIPYTVILVN